MRAVIQAGSGSDSPAARLTRLRVVLVMLLMTVYLFAPTEPLVAEVYQEPGAFVSESFGGHPPPAGMVWLTSPLREEVEAILNHRPASLRLRYWSDAGRTVWILDEIGKELPITAGFVVEKGEIVLTRVLEFRESRGWEVRYDFFTDQFRGASMNGDGKLDRTVDGITGATLSVRAVTRLAQLALLLDRHVSSFGDN